MQTATKKHKSADSDIAALMSALDRMIAAARDAEQARRRIVKNAGRSRQQEGRCNG